MSLFRDFFKFTFYNFSTNIFPNKFSSIELISDGSNNLSNTNNLKTSIINDLNINFNDNINETYGLKNNFNLYFKNLNTLGKNDPKYKDSPQSKISSMFDIRTSLPLEKIDDKYNYSLIPQISLRVSPFNMKNYSTADIATFPWIARHNCHDVGLKKFKNLSRWYEKISEREAAIKGYDCLNTGEQIPEI